MRNIYKVLLGTTLLMGSMSCEDMLEVEPKAIVTKDQVLANGGVEKLVIAAYHQMQGVGYYGSRNMVIGDVLADNIEVTFASNRYSSEYTNEPGADAGSWALPYSIIDKLNLAIQEAPNYGSTEAQANRIIGEAKMLRALVYHNLVRAYGYEPVSALQVNDWNRGVIVRTNPVVGSNDVDFRSRESVESVYQQIEADLLDAVTKLAGTTSNARANVGAAHAILSRVYLYWRKYNEAIDHANKAMNSGVATLTTPATYPASWYSNSNSEAFLQLTYDPVIENLGSNDALFSLTTTVASAWGDLAASQSLLNLYEEEDIRFKMYYQDKGRSWITKWTGSAGTGKGVLGQKPGLSNTWSDNIPVIRYAEVLLIRAEAYAETDREELARQDLNTLRASRNASAITSTGAATLVMDIMDERRRELAFEGHRWFDLKRKGMDVPKPGNLQTIPYSSFKLLARIPIGQAELNPKLEQNPGY